MGETIHQGGRHIHRFDLTKITQWNCTHTFHTFQFGESFPGQQNILNNKKQLLAESNIVAFQAGFKFRSFKKS